MTRRRDPPSDFSLPALEFALLVGGGIYPQRGLFFLASLNRLSLANPANPTVSDIQEVDENSLYGALSLSLRAEADRDGIVRGKSLRRAFMKASPELRLKAIDTLCDQGLRKTRCHVIWDCSLWCGLQICPPLSLLLLAIWVLLITGTSEIIVIPCPALGLWFWFFLAFLLVMAVRSMVVFLRQWPGSLFSIGTIHAALVFLVCSVQPSGMKQLLACAFAFVEDATCMSMILACSGWTLKGLKRAGSEWDALAVLRERERNPAITEDDMFRALAYLGSQR
jgi:hypothetical protein